jgi:hypothetical protein
MPKVVLCCLLVLLTPVDDAWARATPQPDDDAWAAENNDFLPRTADDLAPAPAAPAPGACLPAAVRAAAGQTCASVLRAPSAPHPLYLLMSLRC